MNAGHGLSGMFMIMPFLSFLFFVWIVAFTVMVVARLGKIAALLEKIASEKK